jgi:choline dehydrogenase-like flavoprotein
VSLLRAGEVAAGDTLEAEVCIVGAGAAGITLARALAAAGRAVLLVEGGGPEPDAATQALHDTASIGYPVRPNYMARARQYGGTCNLWAGRSMRLLPIDMEARGWVPWSGWPIGHGEIERWYPEAGKVLGLPDLGHFAAAGWAARLTGAERRLLAGGRLAPTVSLWARRPMRFARVHGGELRRSARIRVLLGANVTAIRLDRAGTGVGHLEAAALDGPRFRIRARRFVLAAGGIENARLLLASSDREPGGIGNRHDLLGRFFMDHPRAVFGRVHFAPGVRLPLMRGLPLAGGKVQLGVALSDAVQREERLLNHYLTFESEVSGYTQQTYEQAVSVAKVVLRRGHAGSRLALPRANVQGVPGFFYLLTPKELMPHWLFRWQTLARDALIRPKGPTRRVVVYFCEQPPDPESRVTLGDERDALGVPRPVLDWKVGADVVGSVMRLQAILGEEVAARGLGRLEPGREADLRFTDASHHMGTTRMGATAAEGVVDTDCRVHGINNLWLAGSSVFPCCGHANPTLTIVALALRLADHLTNI